jgi:hypothetical protein
LSVNGLCVRLVTNVDGGMGCVVVVVVEGGGDGGGEAVPVPPVIVNSGLMLPESPNTGKECWDEIS